jgi:hypothetical protein
MADDPEKTLQELRQRIAIEPLPRLSTGALCLYKRNTRHSPKLVQSPPFKHQLCLSEEARRLFHKMSDPEWPWRR